MATSETPPSSQPQSQSPPRPPALTQEAAQNTHTSTANLQTYTSIGALVLCPLLIALPPRKFDFYTVLLLAGTAVSGDHLLRQYTEGSGIAERFRHYLPQRGRGRGPGHEGDRSGVTAVERQWQGELGGRKGSDFTSTATTTAANTRPLAVSRAVQELRSDEVGGQWGRGRRQGQGEDLNVDARKESAKVDWKAARDAREREALEEGGKGYGGLIVDQIWEVWNWGRDRGRGGGTEVEEERESREGRNEK